MIYLKFLDAYKILLKKSSKNFHDFIYNFYEKKKLTFEMDEFIFKFLNFIKKINHEKYLFIIIKILYEEMESQKPKSFIYVDGTKIISNYICYDFTISGRLKKLKDIIYKIL